MDVVSLLVGVVIGLVVGFLIAWVIRGNRSGTGGDETLLVRATQAEALATERQTQIDSLTQRNAELVAQQEREAKVVTAMAPMREALENLQTKINRMENAEQEQYGKIANELAQTRNMGEYLRATTESLAGALRNNKTRGTWGEVQLQNLVEAAGLVGHVDFVTQRGATAGDRSVRPDMVVRLPGEKTLVIDSKVPFDAFLDANQISETASDADLERRKALLDKHAKDVRAHVKSLADKRYWEAYDFSPEYVIAYVPNESLLAAALEHDPKLLEDSIKQGVALASPISVWAVLKTVAYTWEQQVVTDEAKLLYDLGVELYQRLGTMSSHTEKLRGSLENSVKHFNEFVGALESRVLVTARRFPGIDASKLTELEEIHTETRALTSREFTESAEKGAVEK